MPTNDLKNIGRNFVRYTKEWIGRMLNDHPTLVAYVDNRNTESLKWMRFVGGREVDVVFMGKDGMPFRKFEFKRQELAVRDKIMDIQHKIEQMPNAIWGDAFLVKQKFSDGLYMREAHLPKGHIVVTKLFKQSHSTFLLLGDCSVLTEKGIMRIKAPFLDGNTYWNKADYLCSRNCCVDYLPSKF